MKQSYQIRGMYCPNCEKRIMTALGKMDGVKAVRVDYASGRAEIESKKPLDREQLQSALQNLGYELSNCSDELTRAASLLVIILGLTVILDRVGLLNRLVPRQLGTSGMSYGLFFVTGLLTSVHCVAMCGGIKEYRLIEDGDRIAVCISGGKDSMLMAKLFQELQRHRKVSFELIFLVMDPGYNGDNRRLLEYNAKTLGVPITVFESTIFDVVDTVEKNPCYLCARMRRGYLYSKAKELGCNKIALGHHYDDVIETILMGMLHGGQVQTMMPKLHSTNFDGMELIRPMYFVREADICKWRDWNELHFLQCACHFTDTCTTCHEDGTTSSKRLETKKLIAALKETNPQIEANIFKSVSNVNLNTVIAYKKDGVRHHFLDDYN